MCRQTALMRSAVVMVALVVGWQCQLPAAIDELPDASLPVGTGAVDQGAVTRDSGGEVSVEGTTLTVPPGAVDSDTQLTVTSTTEAAPAENNPLSPVYKFEPEGLEFLVPVQITMPLPSGAPSDAVIYWSKKDGVGFEPLATVLEDGILRANVTHFSSGFVGEASDEDGGVVTSCGVPPSPECGAGCKVSCSGETVAVCHGGRSGADCPPDADCSTSCGAAPTCSCEPIVHDCSVPADSCGNAGCSITCADPTPRAVCVPGVAPMADGAPSPDRSGDGGVSDDCRGRAPYCRCEPLGPAGPPLTRPGDDDSSGTNGGGERPDGGMPPPQTCSSDNDCPRDATCDPMKKVCMGPGAGGSEGGVNCPDGGDCRPPPQGCSSDAECPADAKCDLMKKICVPPSGGPADGGMACSGEGDCRPPPQSCKVDSECPPDAKCDVTKSVCVRGESADGGMSCPDGGPCMPPPPRKCGSDSECPPDAKCDVSQGLCVRGDSADGGSACFCADGSLCDASGRCPTPPGCSTDADCPTGTQCDQSTRSCVGNTPPPPPPSIDGGTACICPDGSICDPNGQCGAPPPCVTDANCPSGSTCDASTGRCGSPPQPPPPPPPSRGCSSDRDCPTGSRCDSSTWVCVGSPT